MLGTTKFKSHSREALVLMSLDLKALRHSTSLPSRGIALLEVLLSVSIIAIGLGALLGTISTGVRTQSRLEQRQTALGLAEARLAEYRATGRFEQAGESEGTFSAPYADYNWNALTFPSRGEDPFSIVVLTIRKGEQGRQRQLLRLQALVNQRHDN